MQGGTFLQHQDDRRHKLGVLWLSLLAQLSIPEGTTSTISQIGAIGISVWFVYHVTAFMLPKINKDNNELTLTIVTDFRELTSKIITDFRDEMRLERESHTSQMTVQREAHATQMIAQRDECRREQGLLMQAYQSQLKSCTNPSKHDSQIIKGDGQSISL